MGWPRPFYIASGCAFLATAAVSCFLIWRWREQHHEAEHQAGVAHEEEPDDPDELHAQALLQLGLALLGDAAVPDSEGPSNHDEATAELLRLLNAALTDETSAGGGTANGGVEAERSSGDEGEAKPVAGSSAQSEAVEADANGEEGDEHPRAEFGVSEAAGGVPPKVVL